MRGHTEDEAKKNWCPLVRTGLVAGMAVNRHVDDRPKGTGVYDETRCIASTCMAWRWLPGEIVNRDEHGPSTHGYCGAFGEPREKQTAWKRET